MIEGDILICKKHNIVYGNENIVGKRYVVKKIESDGNKNIYVSTDLNGCEGIPTCYSSTMFPNISFPHSSMYINEYFDDLVRIRNDKLKQIGI